MFGAELSKDKIVKCININLLQYKLNKTHEGISEVVCGIQVKTVSYSLGFKADEVLYVGRAVRVDTVSGFLDAHKVAYLTG